MATVDKAFRIKNGLVVEGATATVNNSNVLTEASTEFLQDTTGAMFTNGSYTGITFTYNDATGVINAEVSATPTFSDRIIFEGATPDAYELTLLSPEPVADVTVTLPNATDTLVGKATTDTFTNKTFDTAGTGNTLQINGNTVSSYVGSGANVVLSSSPTITSLYVSNGLNVNGATTGTTQIVAANSASGILTLPSATGTVALTSDIPSLTGYVTETGTQTLTNKTLTSPVVDGNGVVFEGSTADAYETTLNVVDPTADRTITLPNVSGTVITTGDSGTVTNAMLQNSSITINGTAASLGGSRTLGTDDIAEGSTNKYFTDERAQDAVAAAIAAGTQTNITITYDDTAGSLSFNASGGVSSISGTANQISASASTGAVTLSLPNAVTFPGTVTLNADPSTGLEAATKQYVDSVAQGLDVKASVKAATTANGTFASDFDNGSVIDGVTLSTGDRILIKNQTDATENGIYIVAASGAPTRSSDMNAGSEFPSAFTFVEQGTTNADTGWVCTNNSVTIGSTNITFAQFSGAGSYLAGTGLSLAGNTFSIDTSITADLTSAQTLTNKTINGSNNTISNIGNGSLTNSSVTINGNSLSLGGSLTLDTDDISEGSTNKYFSDELAQDAVGNAVGSGLSYNDTTGAISNSGVLDLTGTSNQISVSASTGSVTLSLPQDIASTSTPTFGSVSVGWITLGNAFIGSATTSISGTSATVVDSWSATTFGSAKYIVQMTNGNDVEVLEVLVTVDGNNNVYLTEYADVQSNAQIGTTDADYSGGDVRLLVTSTNGTSVKVHRTLINA